MTPEEDDSVTLKTGSGRFDMPVVITARGGSAIACVVDTALTPP